MVVLSLVLILAGLMISCDPGNDLHISSPDGIIQFSLHPGADLQYSASFHGEEIILPSDLGLALRNGEKIGPGYGLTDVAFESKDQTWNPPYGERGEYRDHYNEALYTLSSSQQQNFKLRVRAYTEGLAFRYELNSDQTMEVAEELTSFSFDRSPTVWWSARAQSEITAAKLSDIQGGFERPLLAELDDSTFVAIGEAALVDFARMKLSGSQGGKQLDVVLGLDQPTEEAEHENVAAVIPAQEYSTPWRYIMIGKTPSQLLASNFLVLNLSQENQIKNTDWIKPGKVIREVSLTTQGGLACVDFAVQHNLQYVEFDAGWYGNEYDETSDASTVTVDPKRSPGPLDLQKVVDYARQRDIGIILYVNRRALEQQLDEVLPLYQSWGIAGLKYGFVNVGAQKWTSWLHDAVRKAADHQLMVDVHDEYRPTGYSRTYPNFMTQEGIRGDEESPSNEMVLNTLFTRMLVGAGDHTNCFFADRVQEKMGGHISQMAKSICIYSPWQFLYWYDRPQGSPSKKGGAGGGLDVIPEVPELTFYNQLPTVWDDTKVLDGYPGQYAVMARKKGKRWFLAVLTGTEPYHLSQKLDFLVADVTYTATVYSENEELTTTTKIEFNTTELDKGTLVDHHVPANSGLVIILTEM